MIPQSGNRFSRNARHRRHKGRKLPSVAEEVFEQRGGFEFPDAAIDL
jgi:hypothetical protein